MDSLEEKTLQYWLLLSCPMSAGDAITISNSLLSNLNPSRPLALRVDAYLTRVIVGGHRKKLPQKHNVIPLVKVNAQCQ